MNSFLGILTTWRVTSLLMSERGPFDVFERLRELLGIDHIDHEPVLYPINFLGNLFECFWCLSMWVAIPFALLSNKWLLNWLAMSAGAIVIEEAMIGGLGGSPPKEVINNG